MYILTNKHGTVLYTGVTNDLVRRVYEHKNHLDKRAAIQREKQIKGWSGDRKTDLIFRSNPHWADLYNQILG